jgi:hypothetical protein
MVVERRSLALAQRDPDSSFSEECDLIAAVTSDCAWPDISWSFVYLDVATGEDDRRVPVKSWQRKLNR